MLVSFMPALPHPSTPPPRLWPEGWAVILAGAAAAAILLILLGVGALEIGPGLAALVLIAGVTALLAHRVRGEGASIVAALPETPPEDTGGRAMVAALEALPYPLMVVAAGDEEDPAGGVVVFANRAAEQALRVSADGSPLVTAVRIPQVLEVADEALAGRIAAEAVYETAGAQPRFLRALARPLPDSADGARLALLLVMDETDARRNERMKSDFLANASHELRTPLASLTGFIETLRGHARDDEAARAKFLEIMAVQADRMSRLVADLMSLSRIELNEHIPPTDTTDLSMATMDVIDALGPQALAAGVTVNPVLPPRGAAVVLGDRDQILQVVQNLVDNGMKYAGKGGSVTVEVLGGQTAAQAVTARDEGTACLSLLTPDRPQGDYVLVRVKDTGPGIAREHLPRLTERFYRVEGQKSGERLGTGLGLAIVKHIMNRHRGGLAVETAKGSGAAFLAYFPARSSGG